MITHSISLLGKRPTNEDQHNIFMNLNGLNSNYNSINVFSVFDGHGGKDVAKYLNSHLIPFFTNEKSNYNITEHSTFKKYIIKVFDHIENKLEKKFKNFSYNVGSTALIVIFYKKNDSIYYDVINVGDSRTILCNKHNKAIALSIDHKPNVESEKKRIESMGGIIEYDNPDWRIQGLSVSRAFGDMDAKPYVISKPDIYKYKLKLSDKFIVIACDGLWDVMQNQDVVNFINNKLKSINHLDNLSSNSKKNIAYELANHAINNGSYDNISIIIIFFAYHL